MARLVVIPHPGADLFHLRTALGECATTLSNLPSQVLTQAERLGTYLRWVDEWIGRLRGQLRPTDIDRLFLSPRYLALLQSGAHPAALVATMETELADVGDRLAALLDAIEQQLAAWGGSERLLAVDTSYLMHCTTLDELNASELESLVGSLPMGARIVIPMAVVDELDRLKDGGETRRRTTARRALKTIREACADSAVLVGQLNGTYDNRVSLEVLADAADHVRLPDMDDEIVERVSALSIAVGTPVVLLTGDSAQTLRARVADVESQLCEPREAPAD